MNRAVSRSALAWLPNALTLARVALAPAILVSLLQPALSQPLPLLLSPSTVPAAGFLVLAAVLDWLDGRLARALRAESAFGRFWDPVADKLVVGAALVGGAFAMPQAYFVLPAALMLARDAAVTWLRSQPRHAAATAAPSQLAKWKTALEYLALVVLFAGKPLVDGGTRLIWAGAYPAVATLLVLSALSALWLAAALSLWTGWGYWRRSIGRAG